MASPTQWTWVWVNSGSWWWPERPGMLQSMGLQRVRHDWVTGLNCSNRRSMALESDFGFITSCVTLGKLIIKSSYLGSRDNTLYPEDLCFGQSVQFSRSVVSDSLRPHELQHAGPLLSLTNSLSSLKLRSIESVMPFNHLILCHPLLFLPLILPSISAFLNESALCIRWQKYWSFSFSISPFNEYSGLISFRIDWFDLLAVQGTLKSLLQHHSSTASLFWCSAFFMVQLSHPYMTTGKTIALTRWIFVGKVMSKG